MEILENLNVDILGVISKDKYTKMVTIKLLVIINSLLLENTLVIFVNISELLGFELELLIITGIIDDNKKFNNPAKTDIDIFVFCVKLHSDIIIYIF